MGSKCFRQNINIKWYKPCLHRTFPSFPLLFSNNTCLLLRISIIVNTHEKIIFYINFNIFVRKRMSIFFLKKKKVDRNVEFVASQV